MGADDEEEAVGGGGVDSAEVAGEGDEDELAAAVASVRASCGVRLASDMACEETRERG